ncbi:MAG: hypothetical protein IJJ85_03485 [Clostridia bacterium]|nr:hypothetical protein [Clostridia bacterium]
MPVCLLVSCYEYNPFITGHQAVQRTAILEFTDLICEGTVTQGRQGVIVNVSRWKDLSRPELREWLAAHNNDLY